MYKWCSNVQLFYHYSRNGDSTFSYHPYCYKRGNNFIKTRLQNVFLQWWKFLNQVFKVGFNVNYKIRNASWRQWVAIEVCRLICHFMTIPFPKICYKESEIIFTSLHLINKVPKTIRCIRASSICAFRN